MNVAVTAVDLCRDIFLKQRASLELFFEKFDCESTWLLVEKILHHSGQLFFSGVGKSGNIVRKTVSTLQSFGEKAYFLSPGDMLHGDLGAVQNGDIVCLFSKSGETRELLDCLPHLQAKGAFLVGVTSSAYSSLSMLCHHSIVLPPVIELDPFNLVPTTSACCQLLFGDLLAITLLRSRNISLAEYGKNHPGGQIGLRASGKIRDYMYPKTEVPFCSPDTTVAKSLEIFSSYGYGCVCVVDKHFEIVGIFTDGDLRRALSFYGGELLSQKLANVMTAKPRVISEDADVLAGLQIMESNNPITSLPVVDAQEQRYVVGLLQMHTLAKAGLI